MKTKAKTKNSKWRAYCYRGGRIEFQPITAKPPDGVITIGSGPKKLLIDTVTVLARESRPSKPGGKDTYLLVPGIPEAGDDERAAGMALDRFYHEVSRRIKPPKPVPGPYEVVEGRRGHLGEKGMENAHDMLFIRVKNVAKLNAPMPTLMEIDLTIKQTDQRGKNMFSGIRTDELKATAQFFVDAANAANTKDRTCAECGCTDSHACKGGCSWVVIHKATPTGVCSHCVKAYAKWTNGAFANA